MASSAFWVLEGFPYAVLYTVAPGDILMASSVGPLIKLPSDKLRLHGHVPGAPPGEPAYVTHAHQVMSEHLPSVDAVLKLVGVHEDEDAFMNRDLFTWSLADVRWHVTAAPHPSRPGILRAIAWISPVVDVRYGGGACGTYALPAWPFMLDEPGAHMRLNLKRLLVGTEKPMPREPSVVRALEARKLLAKATGAFGEDASRATGILLAREDRDFTHGFMCEADPESRYQGIQWERLAFDDATRLAAAVACLSPAYAEYRDEMQRLAQAMNDAGFNPHTQFMY